MNSLILSRNHIIQDVILIRYSIAIMYSISLLVVIVIHILVVPILAVIIMNPVPTPYAIKNDESIKCMQVLDIR